MSNEVSKPEVVRVIRPIDFDKALEVAKAASLLEYGVVLRTVLVRDGLEDDDPEGDSYIERYEVIVLDQSPIVEGDSEDAQWGPGRPDAF